MQHFDDSLHPIHRAQTMVMDTLQGLSLHRPGSPSAFYVPSIEEFTTYIALPTRIILKERVSLQMTM